MGLGLAPYFGGVIAALAAGVEPQPIGTLFDDGRRGRANDERVAVGVRRVRQYRSNLFDTTRIPWEKDEWKI